MGDKTEFAYPQLAVESCERDGHGDLIEPFTSSIGGLTKREWFAGMALQGLLASPVLASCIQQIAEEHSMQDGEVFVNKARILADAMIKELRK